MAGFDRFYDKMITEKLPELIIRTFQKQYESLVKKGPQSAMITETFILPVDKIPDYNTLDDTHLSTGKDAQDKLVMLKLNGGLGTSMGMQKAKSLLPVKNGLSFLEIICHQAVTAKIPLVLMNSFRTQGDSLAVMEKFSELNRQFGFDFLQHKVPKIQLKDMLPASFPKDPEQEWCPPGHGDIFTALVTSGMLDRFLEKGYEYGFISNADNLGATLDLKLLGYFAANKLPFLMEVTDRTLMDRKGGHLAQTPDGQLLLRESAQCPESDIDDFQNIEKHRYFNTNNLWINFKALKKILNANNNMLDLPVICNRKNLNPRDKASEPVYQLETAMGSAIGVIPGSQALRVNRNRFLPVKKTSDLMVVRSDIYRLNDDFKVVKNPDRSLPSITLELDDRYYKLIDQFDEHLPQGIPSLINCESFKVEGEFEFGKNIKINGSVELINEMDEPLFIDDDTVIE